MVRDVCRSMGCLVVFAGLVPFRDSPSPPRFHAGFREVVLLDSTRSFRPRDTTSAATPRPVHLYVWYPASQDGPSLRFADLIGDPGAGAPRGSAQAIRSAVGPLRLAMRSDSGRGLLDSAMAVVENAPMGRVGRALLLMGGMNGPPWLHAPLAIAMARRGSMVLALGSYGDGIGRPLPFDSTGFRSQLADARLAMDWLMAGPHRIEGVVVGAWSVGGVAAAALAAADDRIRGVISLDSGLGYDYGPPALEMVSRTADRRRGIVAPLLHLRGDQPGQFAVPRSRGFLDAYPAEARLELTFAGLAHQHFLTALLLTDPQLRAKGTEPLVTLVSAFVDAAFLPAPHRPDVTIAAVRETARQLAGVSMSALP